MSDGIGFLSDQVDQVLILDLNGDEMDERRRILESLNSVLLLGSCIRGEIGGVRSLTLMMISTSPAINIRNRGRIRLPFLQFPVFNNYSSLHGRILTLLSQDENISGVTEAAAYADRINNNEKNAAVSSSSEEISEIEFELKEKWNSIFAILDSNLINDQDNNHFFRLSIITTDKESEIKTSFNRIMKDDRNSSIFEKINLIHLMNQMGSQITTYPHMDNIENIGEEAGKDHNQNDNLWDETFVENGTQLEKIFKEWLRKRSSLRSTEQVRIYFSTDSIFNRPSSVLLCDFFNRFINPLHLPLSLGLFFDKESGVTVSASSSYTKTLTVGGMNKKDYCAPIKNLEILHQVPADGLCQSLIFDHQGIILKPTDGTAYDWNLNLKNYGRFNVFVKKLLRDGRCLIAKNVENDNLFVLIPTMSSQNGVDNAYFLVKSLITQELLLPLPESPQLYDVEESLEAELEIEIDHTLENIEVIDYYDPLNAQTTILQTLEKSGLRKRPTKRKEPLLVETTKKTKY